MSDISLRTGIPVEQFLKLRRLADSSPVVSERFDFFLDGFSDLIGARGDKSFGLPADGGFPGRGFF
jgi:hypothetical protein